MKTAHFQSKLLSLAVGAALYLSTQPLYADPIEENSSCEGHGRYDHSTGIVELPAVDMATIPVLGGYGRSVSYVIGTVTVELSLIPGSNLFEIKDVKEAIPADPNTLTVPACHAEYQMESGTLFAPKVDVDVVTVIHGVPITLGTDTFACTLKLLDNSDLFRLEVCKLAEEVAAEEESNNVEAEEVASEEEVNNALEEEVVTEEEANNALEEEVATEEEVNNAPAEELATEEEANNTLEEEVAVEEEANSTLEEEVAAEEEFNNALEEEVAAEEEFNNTLEEEVAAEEEANNAEGGEI